MRTTVDLPDELLRAAKARAAAEGVSLKEFLARAVAHALSAPAIPRQPHARVSLPLVGTGPLVVEVTDEDIEDLLADDDVQKYGGR